MSEELSFTSHEFVRDENGKMGNKENFQCQTRWSGPERVASLMLIKAFNMECNCHWFLRRHFVVNSCWSDFSVNCTKHKFVASYPWRAPKEFGGKEVLLYPSSMQMHFLFSDLGNAVKRTMKCLHCIKGKLCKQDSLHFNEEHGGALKCIFQQMDYCSEKMQMHAAKMLKSQRNCLCVLHLQIKSVEKSFAKRFFVSDFPSFLSLWHPRALLQGWMARILKIIPRQVSRK